MAQAAADDNGRALWLTLALSWVRLAEHVARGIDLPGQSDGDSEAGAVRSTD